MHENSFVIFPMMMIASVKKRIKNCIFGGDDFDMLKIKCICFTFVSIGRGVESGGSSRSV